jgi:hypothetical protein
MTKNKSYSGLSLEQKIADARRKLQEAYDARGYTDSVVLAASVKLDRLINLYQKKLLEDTVPGYKLRISGLKK